MFVTQFKELSRNDAAVAGGKGASLGEMTSAFALASPRLRKASKATAGQAGGYNPVPPGFVVLALAFERFLEETDLNVEIDTILHTVNHQEMHTVEHASEKIQTLILAAQMPKDIATEIMQSYYALKREASPPARGGERAGVGGFFVAVRSSATAEDSASAAWAGQLDSFLNTTEKDLLQNVQKCWASLFTPRAIFYRFELHDKNRAHGTETERSQHGTHTELDKVSVAVVVQEMVEAEVSGIAFSVHPVTEDRNQMIIEAGFGLGEAIVSGQITPDSYVVEKNPRRILDRNISAQERGLYRAPLYPSKEEQKSSVNEWRDIPKEKGGQQKLSDKQILELSELILKIEKRYGFPCDIEWALAEGKFSILQSRPITTLARGAEKSKNIAERKYKVLRTRKASPFPQLWNYESETQDATEKLHGMRLRNVWVNWDDGFLSAAYDEHEWETVGKYIGNRILKDNRYLKSVDRRQKILGKKAVVYAQKITAASLGDESFKGLLDIYKKLKSVWIGYDHVNVILWYIGGDYYQSSVLDMLLEKYQLSAEEVEKMVTSPHPSFSHDEEVSLYRAALNARPGTVRKFSEKLSARFYWIPFGYDGPTQNTPGFYAKKIGELKQKNKKELETHVAHLESLSIRVANAQSRIMKEHIISDSDAGLIRRVHTLAEMTDYRKEVTFRIHVAVFKVLEALAQKLGIADHNDLRFVSIEELGNLPVTQLRKVIMQRKVGFAHVTNCGASHILTGHDAEKLRKEVFYMSASSGLLKGQVGSRGVNRLVKGPVKVLTHPNEMKKVHTGDILVAIMTTPEYVPAMRKAAAILTDEGGVTCHAAIVSRELGIPAIIAMGNATKILKDGDMVEVDAEKGVEKILKRD